jgi:hypothetical protein
VDMAPIKDMRIFTKNEKNLNSFIISQIEGGVSQ